MTDRKILSVGGSIVIPKTGFNVEFLKKFRDLILKEVEKGKKFILVIGGGATCRYYQEAAKGVREDLTSTDLDWVGINTTIFNAKFVQMLFKGEADPEIVTNPTIKNESEYPIQIGAGYEPGHSTDMDAVLLAETYGVKHILNLSNITHAYTKDPNKFDDAEKIEEIDWQRFRDEVVGDEWDPGKSAPFDPIASKKAQEMELMVSILDGTNLEELQKALNGEKFEGTHIK